MVHPPIRPIRVGRLTPRALILDLRDNPGGILAAALELADRFLDRGVILSTRGSHTHRAGLSCHDRNVYAR